MLELGLALLSGRAGKPWAARAIRARGLMAGAIGGQPPATVAKPLAIRDAREGLLLTPVDATRSLALDAAREIVDALSVRRFERLSTLLAPEVTVLWPSGALARHDRGPLLEELSAREGEQKRFEVQALRSYTLAELRAALARGVADAIDAVLDLRGALLVTLDVTGGRGPGGRVMLAMEPLEAGGWAGKTLLFGAPDDAHLLSVRVAEPVVPDLKVADQVVRRVVLGQGAQLRAVAGFLMPKLWVRDQLLDFEALVAAVDSGPPRIGSAEAVFGATREIELKTLAKHLPAGLLDRIRGESFAAWGFELDAIAPRGSVTDIGVLDPATGKTQPAQVAAALLVRVPDPSGVVRPRAAALFL